MEEKKPQKKKTPLDYLLTLILIIAIGVFCYAGYQLFSIFMEYKEGTDEYKEIANLAVTVRDVEKEDVTADSNIEEKTKETESESEQETDADIEESLKENTSTEVEAGEEIDANREVEAAGEADQDRNMEAAGEAEEDRNVEAAGEAEEDRYVETAEETDEDRNVEADSEVSTDWETDLEIDADESVDGADKEESDFSGQNLAPLVIELLQEISRAEAEVQKQSTEAVSEENLIETTEKVPEETTAEEMPEEILEETPEGGERSESGDKPKSQSEESNVLNSEETEEPQSEKNSFPDSEKPEVPHSERSSLPDSEKSEKNSLPETEIEEDTKKTETETTAEIQDAIESIVSILIEGKKWCELFLEESQVLEVLLDQAKAVLIYPSNPIVYALEQLTDQLSAVFSALQEAKEIRENGPFLQAPLEVDFEVLQDINDDVIGWLYMEAIDSINYPIVQGEDNDEYLHHTYEGKYNFAGTLFIDYENSRDFSDCNTVLYGHNMKNGSMFGKLKDYVNDSETYEKSRYFWIMTPDADYRYEIIAAYTTQVNSDTYTFFSGPGRKFLDYMEKIRKWSAIKTTERKMTVRDRVVTLSTCTGNEATRFVVQGVCVNKILK